MKNKVPPRHVDPLLIEKVEMGLIPWWISIVVGILIVLFLVISVFINEVQ